MEELRQILRRYWGFEDFRPLQAAAMRAVVEGRDSLVVLPTGGGKSLCFQAPALQLSSYGVVVSPLIALMKDQVDALENCGVPAACVNSTMAPLERQRVAEGIRNRRLKLLYLSPERLMSERTLGFFKESPPSFFAIDEAHCISDWGHDFRPEYRMLRALKENFPGVGVHAYTATATERVRQDIIRELQLERPEVLVGSFDRPNLVYRVERRTNLVKQIRAVIDRYRDEAGIIYVIRRADADELSEKLSELGYESLPYHAGMSDEDRKRNQEAFINDRARIIVATVAFGMGIDKSDVRYVIHAAAPKSLEAYQQESGRAGRDGLEAECWLFYSPADFQLWQGIQKVLPPEAYEIAMQVLRGIDRYCTGVGCRHRALLRHFGQELASANCEACDCCLGDVDLVDDALIIGQKILSCVLRLKERFGGDYTAQVLVGSREQRILAQQHDQLSTWGILKEYDKRHVRDWIEQLVGQGFLEKQGAYNVLHVTTTGRALFKGEAPPKLLQPAARAQKESKATRVSWEGVDRGLFDALRKLRSAKAEERGLPPFIVFGDAALRDMARRRPSTLAGFRRVHGVGEKKSADYGEAFVRAIVDYCRARDVPMDVDAEPLEEAPAPKSTGTKLTAFELFAQGKTCEEVQAATGRARSTVCGYLVQYIEANGITEPMPWIDADSFRRILAAAQKVGSERLTPIFEALGGVVPYDTIRIAIACQRNA